MGTVHGTLNQWWFSLKHSQKLVNGPQMAFNLAKGDQTVLLFGEHHFIEDKCGTEQELFTSLFDTLISLPKCDDLTMILELEENSSSINDSVAGKFRLPTLFRLFKKRKETAQCKINMMLVNILDINKRAKQILSKTITSDNDLILYFSHMRSQLRDTMFMFTERLDAIHSSISYARLSEVDRNKLAQSLEESIINKAKKCMITLDKLTNKTSAEHMRESFYCAFEVGLEMLDFYTIVIILNGHKNALVYEGSAHSSCIAAFLVENFGYKVIDVAQSISGNCIRFSKEFDLKGSIQSIRNIFANSDARSREYIENNLNIISTVIR